MEENMVQEQHEIDLENSKRIKYVREDYKLDVRAGSHC